jgi:hypothetical protein
MPIRTNRGRAAVYRRLWGWPLRSPKHLFVTGIAIVVLAIAIAILTANATSSRRAAAAPRGDSDAITTPVLPSSGIGAVPGTGGTSSPSASSTAPTRLTTPPENPVSAAASPAALSVITAWGKAWANHPAGMTNAQWLAQLKPYTTDEFLPQMSSVDVANIDATQVTGAPQATKSFTSSLEALLPTNAGKLDITAIATPTGWLVTSYTEAVP